jgi:hypothetical protein
MQFVMFFSNFQLQQRPRPGPPNYRWVAMYLFHTKNERKKNAFGKKFRTNKFVNAFVFLLKEKS